jgi:PAS domain S-box-containing protein
MHILIVEHNPAQSKLTRIALQERGAEVHCATALEPALECLLKLKIDVVLLDLALPDSPGIETFYQIRGKAPGIPIIIFTEQDDQNLALEAVKHGAQDYVLKNVVGDDSLFRCLQYAIERSRVELALRKSEERLRVILENSHDAFISMDSKWRITDWNTQAEKTFGWQKEEALGQSIASIIPHHLRKQYLHGLEEYFSKNSEEILKITNESFAVHSDGHEFPAEIGIFRIMEDSDYLFCAFVRDITARKKSNEELERLIEERSEKLMQSNEELRQFAKIASHDLQEPLRAVQGFANLLAESTKGKLEKDPSDFIDYILDGTQRMQDLIRSVLTHSQINSSDFGDYSTNCNSVIEEVLSNLNTSIQETEAYLEVDKLPQVAVERSQVVQLFQNLISNALKYRGSKTPEIYLKAEKSVDKWLFSVRDNSIGIDPKYSEKIFDMFARLHGKTSYPGSGMGLAICKKIVTSHGGDIWVESELGHGSIFLFTLPSVRKLRRKKMKDQIEILLVEDTPSDIRLTQEALKRSDLKYEMIVVNDGVEAMDYLNKLKESAGKTLPDIILLDLNMPKKNGHEVLDEIKNDSVLKKIPVVLLTVSQRDEDVMEALKLKMNYYIAKPVTAQKLAVLIKSIHELQTEKSDDTIAHSNEENHIRLVLAGNPHTSPIALTQLADDSNDRVRCRVAENAQVPQTLLAKLANDPSTEVRLGVSENLNVPASILELLAQDPSEDVRLGLAGNPRIPEHILKNLVNDENIHVSSSASKTLCQISAKS